MSLEGFYLYFFLCLVFLIAFLYSGVGHGGASGYLALMALFSFDTKLMRPIALFLNLFVSGIAAYQYYKAGYFRGKLFLYFAILSVPMAFIGGYIVIDSEIYKKFLGVFLLFAVAKLLNIIGKRTNELISGIVLWKALLIGASIGFLSGLIGIGGGIILSPIILLLRWGRMRESAAVSALFILVNSVAGLAGDIYSGTDISGLSLAMVVAAVVGGFLGSYYGSYRLGEKTLKYLVVGILLLASLKLFFF